MTMCVQGKLSCVWARERATKDDLRLSVLREGADNLDIRFGRRAMCTNARCTACCISQEG